MVFIDHHYVWMIEMVKKKEIEQLHKEIKKCTKCPLHKTRKNAVPGEGSLNAKLMFIGEAPGALEDELGRPFVGKSGELLTELMNGINLSRKEVFITSVLKSRPPGNRTPNKTEIEACRYYMRRQLELIKPQIAVLLGGVAISSIIGPWRVSDAHGQFYEAEGQTFFMTYHPAAALRSLKIRNEMKYDFEILKRELI